MPVMESVTLENFRCFREKQTVRLAPLTLLVGENSTGKTSFLALIRILIELQQGSTSPDFKADPFDLGSFDEIAHFRGGRGGRASRFTVGFEAKAKSPNAGEDMQWEALYSFGKQEAAPVLLQRRLLRHDLVIDQRTSGDGGYDARLETRNGSWLIRSQEGEYPVMPPTRWIVMPMSREEDEASQFAPIGGSPAISEEDRERLRDFAMASDGWPFFRPPFASAPVRSKPRRTYDPARGEPDPEGDYIPMYLAERARRRSLEWQAQKSSLEKFGSDAGLFTELNVRLLGKSDSDPFQLQIRKAGKRLRGPLRNLIDVGYGVSQVLPIVTELLSGSSSEPFLLQQPEVHLHPRAQAALGTYFCGIATRNRHLIVETHSDHLIDRIRMEVRDGSTALKPEDVLVLYFERDELDVKIHEIGFDSLGNVCGAPDSYGDFMMQETRRSLGL